MRHALCLTLWSVLLGSGLATAQEPEIVYEWAGVPSATNGWHKVDGPLVGPGYNIVNVSAATGDLVVTETGNGTNGTVGGTFWVRDDYSRPREIAPEKGNLDVTGLDYMEIDLQHNHPTGNVDVYMFLHIYVSAFGIVSYHGGSDGLLNGPAWPIGAGLHTIRFPLNQLTPREQTSIGSIIVIPAAHEALGNLTWTISEVRTVGTPLIVRDIVTNNLGSPDDGVDGAFPLNTADMLAIVGNTGVANQVGLARNPSGSGSLQWTDKGGTGDEGDESGASIGWGNGAGWRNAQPGDPATGNSYNERIASLSNYDRMTVTISALDATDPAGTVGIEGVFAMCDPAGSSLCSPPPPPTILPSQNLSTDGQYHELEYDLLSVSFLKGVWHWGLDVAPHPNEIVFNIDNIRFWNSSAITGVLGDYNNDGMVNAADYTVWRDGRSTLPNEGVTPGSNTPEDYDFWRSRFGATSGSGSGAAAVPEPSVAMLLLTAMVGTKWWRHGI